MQVSNSVPEGAEKKANVATLFPSGHLLPFAMVTFLFFLWGIPNNLTDVLIRQFMKSFAISRFQAAMVQSAQFGSYFIMAMLLGAYALANVALVSVGVLRPGWAGLWAILLTSVFMSLMFPTIFALGLKGLGPKTKIGRSLIVMAIVGGALIPPLMGKIAEARHSMALAYVVPLLAYVAIAAPCICRSRGA